MRTNGIGFAAAVCVSSLLTLFACGGGSDTGSKSQAGENCTRTADCADGLSCIGSVCVLPGTDGDNETDTPECGGACAMASDMPKCVSGGKAVCSCDVSTWKSSDCNALCTAQGKTSQGCGTLPTASEVGCLCKDAATEDGDAEKETESAAENDSELEAEKEAEAETENECNPHASQGCKDGDSYWKDCDGNWTDKKDGCGTCGCEAATGACATNDMASTTCYDRDVYYVKCTGDRGAKKDECGTCGCKDGECIVSDTANLVCYDDDVYYADCNMNRKEKSEECGACGCEANACKVVAHAEKRCVGNDIYWFDCKGQQSDLYFHCDDTCENATCVKYKWTDPATNLTWTYNASEALMYFPEAGPYCDALTLGGFDDWRLPTIGELRSIIVGCPATVTGGLCTLTDACVAQTSGCTVEYCSGCTADAGPSYNWYMNSNLMPHFNLEISATEPKGVTTAFYGVMFQTGFVGWGTKTAANGGVRCVRGTASKPL